MLINNVENIDLTLSYSKISDFDRNGPKALVEKSIPDNQQALKMGGLIDDLLFSKKSFDSKYFVSDFNEPTATLGKLTKIILDNYVLIPDVEEVFNIIEKNKFWSSTKDREILQKNFDTDEFWSYLEDKFSTDGRIVITSSEKIRADGIVETLSNHDFSKIMFDSKMEHIYQYKFEIKIKEFKCRGILDIISIDHKNKKVYFKDLKTGGGPSSEFLSSFIKWRYYLQEAVYCLAFKKICKDLGLKDYTLEPFEFIYIGLKEKIPVNFIVSEKWHNAALQGFETSGGYKYKGLYTLLDEIYFHWKNKVYDLSKSIYESKGRVELESSFINVKQIL